MRLCAQESRLHKILNIDLTKGFISIRLISLYPPKDDLERTSNGQWPPPKLIQTSVMHGFSCLTYVGLRIRSPDLNPFLQVEFKNIVSAVTNNKQGCRCYSPCNWQYNKYHKTITSNFDDVLYSICDLASDWPVEYHLYSLGCISNITCWYIMLPYVSCVDFTISLSSQIPKLTSWVYLSPGRFFLVTLLVFQKLDRIASN